MNPTHDPNVSSSIDNFKDQLSNATVSDIKVGIEE